MGFVRCILRQWLNTGVVGRASPDNSLFSLLVKSCHMNQEPPGFAGHIDLLQPLWHNRTN